MADYLTFLQYLIVTALIVVTIIGFIIIIVVLIKALKDNFK